MSDFDRRLREVSQLRQIWRAFRDSPERAEDERLSRPLVRDFSGSTLPRDPLAAYGLPVVRAAMRYWWCRRQYEAIVTLGDRLDSGTLEAEPLLHVYLEAARLSRGDFSERQR